MAIEYRIILDEIREFNYRIELERDDDQKSLAAAPKWTRLDYQQCSNCPLSKDKFSHCPAAIDLYQVIEDFKGLPAIKKAKVEVHTPQRDYSKQVSLEEGLRSLLGLIMATSSCPVLGRLRPMAEQHLPFASNQEFTLRAISLYLAGQYFNLREGRSCDWELKGLVETFQQLQLVNQAFWQRIHDTCAGDSNLKALLTFFSMSSGMSFMLEVQLQKIRPLLMGASSTP